MLITHYQRRRRPVGNYSLEAIFQDIRGRLKEFEIRHIQAPCYSNGLFRRLWIALYALWTQRGITHVTGDITFAAIALNKSHTVLTILDCIGADRPGFKGWLYRKIWIEWPVRRSQFVTTISEASKADIVRYAGCDPNKIMVTGVAISTVYQPSPSSFNISRPRLLQLGTAPNKNIERLAAALRGRSCELRIIGELSQSQSRALEEHQICYTHSSALSEAELLEEYRRCDVVTFASTFEGFGMPILEGNAVGRVVVTGNRASMPDVAGDAACLVDPFSVESIRDGINRVIEDSDYRNRLIDNGYKNVLRYSSESVAAKYRDIYLRVYHAAL